MYNVSTWSHKALTNVYFFIWSYVIWWASHTTFVIKQNWFGSSFPKPLNTCSFTEFSILNSGGGRSGAGEGVCGNGEDGVSVGGWGIHGNPWFINWTKLCREAYASSSLSLRGGSISGLYSGPFSPLFLKVFPLHIAKNIKVVVYPLFTQEHLNLGI